jgi:hypothetical protein
MNELVLDRAAEWRRMKALVLDSVSLADYAPCVQPRPRPNSSSGSARSPVPASPRRPWPPGALPSEARGLGPISINVRITAVRKLAVEAADNGLLAPELAAGITRIKGVAAKGVRLGNWLCVKQAQALLNAPDAATKKGLRDRAILAVLLGDVGSDAPR